MPQPDRAPVLDEHAVAFVHGGVAAVVATRDGDLRPQITRAWGPHLSADGSALTICVVAPAGSKTRENLDSNGAIAVVCCPPTIARAIQFKGKVVATNQPDADDLVRADEHMRAFGEECARIGLSASDVRQLFRRSELLAVQVDISEAFEQSPGPTAGRRL
jgi:hypothetical protein